MSEKNVMLSHVLRIKYEKNIMAKNISALTPETIRSDVSGINLEKLIGRWVTIQDGDTRTKVIIINAEIQFHEGSSEIVLAALNKRGFAQFSATGDIRKEDIFGGTLLSFSATEKKGFSRSKDGRTLPFVIANQSETPKSLKEELTLMERFPVGETFDIPDEIATMVRPPIPYKEAIITGYALSIKMGELRYAGSIILMDAIHPKGETSQAMVVALLDLFGVNPVPRPTKGRAVPRKKFDA